MPGNTFGHSFRITTFGESHGGALGVVIDGCPGGLTLDVGAIQAELDRRRPGQSRLTSQRKELDQVEIVSGLFEGKTLGTALTLMVRNEDADPKAYEGFREVYRPSHADYSYDAKYGHRAWAGGGRASARETVGRVAAGAVAAQILRQWYPIEVVAWVATVQDLVALVDGDRVMREDVEAHPTRCPDPEMAPRMEERIQEARKSGDTVGGIIRAVARGVPPGWGEPVFDKLEADLAKAMLSLPACKGFESGSGYAGTLLTGLSHNDPFVPGPKGPQTTSNRSGGIQGGISNGMAITLSAAFKPVATVFRDQQTVDIHGRAVTFKPRGRHDPCVLPRAVPMVEAMIWLVLCDHALRQRALRGSGPSTSP